MVAVDGQYLKVVGAGGEQLAGEDPAKAERAVFAFGGDLGHGGDPAVQGDGQFGAGWDAGWDAADDQRRDLAGV